LEIFSWNRLLESFIGIFIRIILENIRRELSFGIFLRNIPMQYYHALNKNASVFQNNFAQKRSNRTPECWRKNLIFWRCIFYEKKIFILHFVMKIVRICNMNIYLKSLKKFLHYFNIKQSCNDCFTTLQRCQWEIDTHH